MKKSIILYLLIFVSIVVAAEEEVAVSTLNESCDELKLTKEQCVTLESFLSSNKPTPPDSMPVEM